MAEVLKVPDSPGVNSLREWLGTIHVREVVTGLGRLVVDTFVPFPETNLGNSQSLTEWVESRNNDPMPEGLDPRG